MGLITYKYKIARRRIGSDTIDIVADSFPGYARSSDAVEEAKKIQDEYENSIRKGVWEFFAVKITQEIEIINE